MTHTQNLEMNTIPERLLLLLQHCFHINTAHISGWITSVHTTTILCHLILLSTIKKRAL